VLVTHVITRLIVGGAQENTLATALGLRARPGCEVELLSGPTCGPEGSLEPQAAGVPGLLHIIPDLIRPVHPWRDGLAFRQLARRFARRRPDLVHTHSGKAGLLGRWAARRAGVPVIVHTIHGPSFGAFQGPLANAAFRAAERFAGARTTHFIAVAEAMIDQYLAAGIGRREQYTRVYSGFDLSSYQAAANDPATRRRLGLSADDFVIGKIARLFKLKGHDDLLAAAPAIARQCPKAKFLLVGDGLWRERLENQVRQLGLAAHFRFTGLVPPDAIPSLVGIMDVLVHLSRREGLPRALPQALAAGKPVVAYDCDGAREVCRDGHTGLLLPPGADISPAVLALAADPSRRISEPTGGPLWPGILGWIKWWIRFTHSICACWLAARPLGNPRHAEIPP
jgi:glycosyltransferase involved in cell wall biosynthesis